MYGDNSDWEDVRKLIDLAYGTKKKAEPPPQRNFGQRLVRGLGRGLQEGLTSISLGPELYKQKLYQEQVVDPRQRALADQEAKEWIRRFLMQHQAQKGLLKYKAGLEQPKPLSPSQQFSQEKLDAWKRTQAGQGTEEDKRLLGFIPDVTPIPREPTGEAVYAKEHREKEEKIKTETELANIRMYYTDTTQFKSPEEVRNDFMAIQYDKLKAMGIDPMNVLSSIMLQWSQKGYKLPSPPEIPE